MTGAYYCIVFFNTILYVAFMLTTKPDIKSFFLPHTQLDSAWKDILDVYFAEFIEFFYPALSNEIDWSVSYTVLDKELNALSSAAEVSERYVDKLIRVQSRSGEERWVLIHIEVQGQYDENFSQRLFEYYYRLYDRYRKPIISLAILADDKKNWRPQIYQAQVWNIEVLTFRFLTIKLLDLYSQREYLEQTTNPFGMVVLAHLSAKQTRKDLQARFDQKFSLTRRLYERGLSREAIMNLYKFIDWVLTLPKDLEIRYNDCIHALKQEKTMGYITSGERISMEKGYKQGIAQGMQQGEYSLLLRLLERKFNSISETYRQKLINADAATLLVWGERVLDAKTLAEVFTD